VEGFTTELRDERGVEMLDSPEAVADASDLVFITAVDARVHPDIFARVVDHGKPVFIDKPFALNSESAKCMLDLAARAGVPLMSCSSLRYSEELLASLESGRDDIIGCDCYGPMNEEPTHPGLFWYGCHTVEMMVAIMGAGCREVRCLRTDSNDALVAAYDDGRIATIHGVRRAHWNFGAILHRKDGARHIDASAGRPYYLGLLDAILNSLPNGLSAVPAEEMIEVVRIMEAANMSRATGGAPVTL
jgi:predicted dehydrogenase